MSRATMLLIASALTVMMCVGVSSAGAVEAFPGRQLLQVTSVGFPPNCTCDRNITHSPYRLDMLPPSTVDGLVKYCFSIDNSVKCDPAFKCCNGKQGVEKVEFDVKDICKDSLKQVTVDGKEKSYEYNTALDVLRITKLGLSAADAPGTQICLLLKAASTCPTLQQMCAGSSGMCKYAIFNQDRDCCPVRLLGAAPPPPPPFEPGTRLPPPPPPATFPFCNCNRSLSASRMFPTRSVVAPVGNMTKICFKVDVKDTCDAGSRCCSFNLYKLEIDANPACKDSLWYSTLDGKKRVRFFQMSPYPAIKVNNINKPFSSVDGTEVCLFMRGGCDSVAELCPGGKCTVSLFNKPGSNPSCCPTAAV